MAEARLASASSLKSALKYAKRAARLRPGVGGAAALVAALRVLRANFFDHYGILRLPPLSSAAEIVVEEAAPPSVLRANSSDHYGVLRLPPLSSAAEIVVEEAALVAMEVKRMWSPREPIHRAAAVEEAEEQKKRAAWRWAARREMAMVDAFLLSLPLLVYLLGGCWRVLEKGRKR